MPEQRTADNLALIFQEILTAIVRLRANRQSVADAESFRSNALMALRTAEQQSRTAGYSGEAFKGALLAVVGFLDETILNCRNPVFADWPRKPLSDELFGHHRTGEFFFDNVDRLLADPDSPMLADVLEVYQLCLLLGFGGRLSGSRGELRSLCEAVAQKIRRIRGDDPILCPDWAPRAQGPIRSGRDLWSRSLALAAILCLLVTLGLFVGFKTSLGAGISKLNSIADTIAGTP